MTWIVCNEGEVTAYIDVAKIYQVTGILNEKKVDTGNLEYILVGTISLRYSEISLPFVDWEYNMGVPKINKKVKDPEKQKQEIKKWKYIAFQKAKTEQNNRISKIIHYFESIKTRKDGVIAYDFTEFYRKLCPSKVDWIG